MESRNIREIYIPEEIKKLILSKGEEIYMPLTTISREWSKIREEKILDLERKKQRCRIKFMKAIEDLNNLGLDLSSYYDIFQDDKSLKEVYVNLCTNEYNKFNNFIDFLFYYIIENYEDFLYDPEIQEIDIQDIFNFISEDINNIFSNNSYSTNGLYKFYPDELGYVNLRLLESLGYNIEELYYKKEFLFYNSYIVGNKDIDDICDILNNHPKDVEFTKRNLNILQYFGKYYFNVNQRDKFFDILECVLENDNNLEYNNRTITYKDRNYILNYDNIFELRDNLKELYRIIEK